MGLFSLASTVGDKKDNVEKELNSLYGYSEEDEAKKKSMIQEFMRYLQESKERDQAKLRQSRMV